VAFVVTDNCSGCRFTDCVEVCPVSCFHEDVDRVYIDPEVCIDCGACLPLCPVKAIVEEYDLEGTDKEEWIAINATKAATLPVVRMKKLPLEGAEARKAALGY
jgi:ferredoxin